MEQSSFMFLLPVTTVCLYLAPEEGFSARTTVLVVYELKEEKVEESYERSHTEPEEEGQAGVSVGHVLFVGQNGFKVKGMVEILQVALVW